MNHSSEKNKVALITGGSRGIGKALVERFKREGFSVITCATRIENLKDSPADLKLACKVENPVEVKAMIQTSITQFKKIDVLVNNAGLAGGNSLDPSESDELWHQIMDVNLHGTYYLCKYAAPYLSDHSGRIINISSVLGLKGVPDQTAYCAAKHGVIGFTKAFALHLAPRKITVNAVCPGWVKTDMAHGRMKELGLTEASLEKSVPLARMIEPSEIADFVYVLSTSPASHMITGQALTIDGGALL